MGKWHNTLFYREIDLMDGKIPSRPFWNSYKFCKRAGECMGVLVDRRPKLGDLKSSSHGRSLEVYMKGYERGILP